MNWIDRLAKRIGNEIGIVAVKTTDDTVLFDGTLTAKDLEQLAEIIDEEKPNPDQGLGDKGLRDPEFPCKDYDPSARVLNDAEAQCETDGHYLCFECKYRKQDTEILEDE